MNFNLEMLKLYLRVIINKNNLWPTNQEFDIYDDNKIYVI